MSTATPPKVLTTIGPVTHPRRNCDEVFTTVVGWVRARGARLIGLPGMDAPDGSCSWPIPSSWVTLGK